jgi:hypothetical protein
MQKNSEVKTIFFLQVKERLNGFKKTVGLFKYKAQILHTISIYQSDECREVKWPAMILSHDILNKLLAIS